MPIPVIPGDLVPHQSEQEHWLKAEVARLCQLEHHRFPGSQPVSFSQRDLEKLEKQDFWVCEKSDGIRVLCLISTDLRSEAQNIYLIDRHNEYRQLSGLFFPHHENPRKPLRNSIIDGELVIDVDPRTKTESMRYLAFDCLVVDDQNVMSRPLDKRYGRLKEWLHKPYDKMIRDHPHMANAQPFEIKVKEMSLSYHVEDVFSLIPNLKHGNDGLVYTCVTTPYTPATDPNIIKWKPPSENSIDFKLILRFPPLVTHPDQPDFHAKPVFVLHAWNGERGRSAVYDLYDELHVTDEEWEKMKVTGEQYDDRIVEVHWDPNQSCWRLMRFRDDKPNGNHRSTVEKIIQSIAEGVEKEVLRSRSNAIRNAWKARHGQPQPPSAHPPPSRGPPNHQGPPPLPPTVGRPVPAAEFRYGPLQQSQWSKVSGPATIAGMKR
ncbi:mRNA capping enzyme, alpha subunit [Pluteus cervinus]|uniref:mRNA capping enzyme, alpha subunit n=1 Tax=Pluteus cervinus TaxID=181527 RepID=A0ACD3ABX2_9AGAR|nr:mRNA capping enzyme, alpha subunit [Pluteus cervinus]